MRLQLFLSAFLLPFHGVLTTEISPKHVEILNESGAKIQVFWIEPSTGRQVPFSDVYNGAHLKVESFTNHTFVVRQMKDELKQSRIGYVTVTDSNNQVVFIKENMEIKHMDGLNEGVSANSTESTSLLSEKCLRDVEDSSVLSNETIDAVLACFEESVTKVFEAKNREISAEEKARKHVAQMLENYTCGDSELPSSEGKQIRGWTYNDTQYDVQVLHERNDSQIHLIRNFITKAECDAFQEAASKTLHRGTVADGSGGSRLSESRKAWQAGVRVPWESEADGDILARYTRRMYGYANYATGFGMDVEGQEDIMSIQYFGLNGEHPPGSVYSPNTPDRYTPHCDGNCEGLPHRKGARVATMVAYCTVPTKGGATNFQNVGAHVKPELGAAVFFSYMNADTKVMDTGWTTHSGCPVVEGTKRIVVHWMRVGVTAVEPWDSFNTLNIPTKSVEEYL